MLSTGEGNGKPLQYSCLENPMNSMKRQKYRIGKTTRPFRYDLNQIPYDHTVEVTNRVKGLDLIECGVGNGNSLQYFCMENHKDSPLVGYSPWGYKELDSTEHIWRMRQNFVVQFIHKLKCWLCDMRLGIVWRRIGPFLLANAGCRH